MVERSTPVYGALHTVLPLLTLVGLLFGTGDAEIMLEFHPRMKSGLCVHSESSC